MLTRNTANVHLYPIHYRIHLEIRILICTLFLAEKFRLICFIKLNRKLLTHAHMCQQNSSA